MPMEKAKFNCLQCGAEFRASPSRKKKYCTIECAWKSKDRVKNNPQNNVQYKVEKSCGVCGKTFIPKTYYNKKFCSKSCASKFAATQGAEVETECLTCQKPFKHYKSDIRKYCSRKCYSVDLGPKKQMLETKTQRGIPLSTYSRGIKGKRRGQYFRSRMEANYAAYLDSLGTKWVYEPTIFWFPIKRGCVSYTPDFFLPEENRYIETKGWMDQKSKTKLKRMEKYHPDIKLEIVDWQKYKEIAKNAKSIPGWEYTGNKRAY